MRQNDEYIHELVVMLYIFMVLSDECIHHDLEVIFCLYMALKDEYTFSHVSSFGFRIFFFASSFGWR